MTRGGAPSEAKTASRRKPRAPRPSEYQIHVGIVDGFNRLKADGVMLIHVPNQGARSARSGAHLKAMGLAAGVPDLLALKPGGEACWLEVKRPGETLSPAQVDFRKYCHVRDISYAAVFSIDEGLSTLWAWGCLARRPTGCTVTTLTETA